MSSRLTFLALSKSGWGEITLALRIAHCVQEAGIFCEFLADTSVMELISQQGFAVEPLVEENGEAFLDWLTRRVEGQSGVVLVDMYLTGSALFGRGLHPRSLLKLGPVLIGIDTWNFTELGAEVDISCNLSQPIVPLWRTLPNRIVPVPFARPGAPMACRLLPKVAGEVPCKEAIRNTHGLGSKPFVLLCTSWWQHDLMEVEGCPPIIDLLGLYLRRLGDLSVVHVGPKELPLETHLGSNYRKMPPMPANQFAGLVAAADLVLSTNASATTNTTAVLANTPVMTVVHSNSVSQSGDFAFAFGYRPSAELAQWAQTALPMANFYMWPMRWMDVLPVLLTNNPYRDLINPIEILDERAFDRVARELLFDQDVLQTQAELRESYLGELEACPGPVERLRDFLS